MVLDPNSIAFRSSPKTESWENIDAIIKKRHWKYRNKNFVLKERGWKILLKTYWSLFRLACLTLPNKRQVVKRPKREWYITRKKRGRKGEDFWGSTSIRWGMLCFMLTFINNWFFQHVIQGIRYFEVKDISTNAFKIRSATIHTQLSCCQVSQSYCRSIL